MAVLQTQPPTPAELQGVHKSNARRVSGRVVAVSCALRVGGTWLFMASLSGAHGKGSVGVKRKEPSPATTNTELLFTGAASMMWHPILLAAATSPPKVVSVTGLQRSRLKGCSGGEGKLRVLAATAFTDVSWGRGQGGPTALQPICPLRERQEEVEGISGGRVLPAAGGGPAGGWSWAEFSSDRQRHSLAVGFVGVVRGARAERASLVCDPGVEILLLHLPATFIAGLRPGAKVPAKAQQLAAHCLTI
jgi:hypothetical protein